MFYLLENKFILKLSHMYTNTAEAEKIPPTGNSQQFKKKSPPTGLPTRPITQG